MTPMRLAPRLFSLLFVFLLLLSCHRPSRNAPVILISIDTLRSDHLPAYGSRAIATPSLDLLARDGIVFEHAYANVPLTLPSHATIFTGLLPPRHGVRDNAGFVLDSRHPTIASLLRARGYATGAAVSAWVLRRDRNLAAGFDEYDDRIPLVEGAPSGNLQRDGALTEAALRRWIEGHRTQPFFAFLHIFEPHAPYEPSYAGEIVKADRIVGDLLAALRAWKLYDEAMIIVLSDHGEGLGDHGEQEHGILLYRESLQVPLIVKLPRGARAGERIAAPAQLADVLPTIAAVLGVEPPAAIDGRSLLSLPPSRPIYGETLYPRIHLGWSDLRSLIRFPMHLVRGPKPELYDLGADPRERNDLRDARRRDAAQLGRDLDAFPEAPASAQPVDAEERRKLAALGYVDAGAVRVASDANPRDRLGDLAELKSVTELMARRDYAAAARRIEDLLRRNPGWSDLRDDLALAYEQLGDLGSAERTYRDGIRATPELSSELALSLAAILAKQGKLDEAAAHAEVAKRVNPAGAHELLARIALVRGELAAAMEHADALASTPAYAIAAEMLRAEVLAKQKRRDEAWSALGRVRARAASERAPLPPRFWFVTGDVLAGTGRMDEARAALERAIAADPGDRDAYVALSFVEAASGDRDAAARVLRRMTAAIPASRAEAEQIRGELQLR